MNNPPATLFDQFLKERTFLKNVTPSTLVWYQVAFKNYRKSLGVDELSLPTKSSLQHFVIGERERGIRPVTVNTYIAAMNAFCVWLHTEGHVANRIKLPKLRVERRMRTAAVNSGGRSRVRRRGCSTGCESRGCPLPDSHWS